MSDELVSERIAAWEAAGLIDAATAARLREAESALPAGSEAVPPGGVGSAVASLLGPPISIVELFAYLGSAFVLAAWHTLVGSLFPPNEPLPPDYLPAPPNYLGIAVQWVLPALVLAGAGYLLGRGVERQRRAAGVAYGVATVHVYVAVRALLAGGVIPSLELADVVGAGAALAAAALFRRLHPAVATQVGLIGAIALLTSEILGWADVQFLRSDDPLGPDPAAGTARAVLTIGFWLAAAVALGLLARFEWRRGGEAAARRADVTRFGAGLTAIGGTTIGALVDAYGGRAIEPWLGDLAIFAVAGALLAIAVRWGAGAYLYPAALGAIIAFSDLNARYVASQTGSGVALLVEGVILIGVGFAADRLRRRLDVPLPPPPDPPGQAPEPEVQPQT